jgi:mono/diheme cytochrome c family protein
MKSLLKSKALIILSVVSVSILLFAFTPAIQEEWEIPAKYQKMKNPTTADDANLLTGKTLYKKHCKSCHGSKGLGDGPKAENLETPIRSLKDKEYKAQADGVKYYKSFIGRDEMPNFEKKITDEEDRWFIINYMETL